MPFLTVVIPTYNRKQSLVRTLDALARQTLSPERFEVVIVSDGSTDGSGDAVKERDYAFRLRFLEQANSGPSVARNYGSRAACGQVIVYLDDDVEPVEGFLERHAMGHEADNMLVLIGPQSMPRNEHYPAWIAWEHRMLERQYDKFRSGEWEIGPNNLYSGNFSVRREFLIRIGGFDEKFKRQEDVELGFRLAELGLRFEFDPEADGIHRPERTFESWYTTPYLYGVRDVQMSRDKGQEQAMLLARKHYRQRSLLTRILAKGIIGRPLIEPLLFRMLRPGIASLDRIGLRRAAIVLCSLTFNLRYLQGMAHEMGGARPMWSAIAGKAAPAG